MEVDVQLLMLEPQKVMQEAIRVGEEAEAAMMIVDTHVVAEMVITTEDDQGHVPARLATAEMIAIAETVEIVVTAIGTATMVVEDEMKIGVSPVEMAVAPQHLQKTNGIVELSLFSNLQHVCELVSSKPFSRKLDQLQKHRLLKIV